MLAPTEGSLIPSYRLLHAKGKFPGYSIEPYVPKIAELVRATGASTLLDYGCGAAKQYTEKRWHEAWGVMPTLYDPAVPEFSYRRFPMRQFDGVICTDVLEHVPIEELSAVIADLVDYARMWCFISVCCRLAKRNKRLMGNRNVHVTIRSQEWWWSMLGTAFDGHAELHLEFTP